MDEKKLLENFAKAIGAENVLRDLEQKKIKETASVGGLGFNSGNPAASGDKVSSYIETNGLAKDDENGALIKIINDSHTKLHEPLCFKAFNPIQFKKAK